MCELKIHRGVMCHENEEWCRIWRGIDLLFQNWHEEIDEFWPKHSKVLKNLHFNGLLLKNVYNVWANKVQRSSVPWHWRVMQNLKRNWLFVSKFTWEIWRILTWALESLKNLHFNGFLLKKVCNVWAKKQFETTRSTRCSEKTLFYLGNKWIAQLTKLFTHVLQKRCF